MSEEKLQLENSKLKKQLAFKKELEFLFEDSIPKEEKAQKEYVTDVAFFYQKILKEKIRHFIGLQMEQIAQFGRSEKESEFYRSNINCFRLMDEWCERLVNHHVADLEEAKEAQEDNETFIKNLKDKHVN